MCASNESPLTIENKATLDVSRPSACANRTTRPNPMSLGPERATTEQSAGTNGRNRV
jgi:hypothetical protein